MTDALQRFQPLAQLFVGTGTPEQVANMEHKVERVCVQGVNEVLELTLFEPVVGGVAERHERNVARRTTSGVVATGSQYHADADCYNPQRGPEGSGAGLLSQPPERDAQGINVSGTTTVASNTSCAPKYPSGRGLAEVEFTTLPWMVADGIEYGLPNPRAFCSNTAIM